ncbi:hypothetical protein BKA69DRAFT_1068961 [Paraphysoderma sedebokerense]|nr:hypothetical protein BKA69DRAFT_1068961 [Paraphysoderma sedebokerense]
MIGNKTVLITALLAAVICSVSAQSPQDFDPALINTTDLATREAWCQSQVSVCENVCEFRVTDNKCSTRTLLWTCACANKEAKIDEEVDLTIPYFTCLTYKWTPCFNNCAPSNQACVDSCNSRFVCGKIQARKQNGTTSATPTATPSSRPPSIDPSVAFSNWNGMAAGMAVVVGGLAALLLMG